MSIFAGQMNLSLKALTLDIFYELAIDFISYGFFIAEEQNYREKIIGSFEHIKRQIEKLLGIRSVQTKLFSTDLYMLHIAVLRWTKKYHFVILNESCTNGSSRYRLIHKFYQKDRYH